MQSYKNLPLSKYTTLKIGGNAPELIVAQTEEELISTIKKAHQNHQQYLIIGGGSNLLVSDEGVNFLVIKNIMKGIEPVILGTNGMRTPESKDAGQVEDARKGASMTLAVQSGTALQELVDYTIERGLAGLQKLTGIPGTVGGAIFGNAGAYGQTVSDHITDVVCFDGAETITLKKDECDFKYRSSYFKKSVYTILEIHFELEKGDTEILKTEAENILQQRLKKYPAGIKCPGSFFKNIVADTLPADILSKIPPEKIVYGKIPAGSLLEEVGAKGAKLGSIEIAPYHANLFINTGNGTAHDFYELAKEYTQKVYQKFGIKLEPEVQLINLPQVI